MKARLSAGMLGALETIGALEAAGRFAWRSDHNARDRGYVNSHSSDGLVRRGYAEWRDAGRRVALTDKGRTEYRSRFAAPTPTRSA